MSIKNDQRREVAARLREVETLEYDGDEWCDEGDVLDALGLYNDDDPSSCDPSKVAFLSALIDRPTCRNVSGYKDTFECSECRLKVDVLGDEGNEYGEVFSTPFIPHFCPNCGAEVCDE